MTDWRSMVADALSEGTAQPPRVEQPQPMPAEPIEAPFSAAMRELAGMKPPKADQKARWRQILADSQALITSWGVELQAYGWNDGDLFGLDTGDDAVWYGLVFAIRGGRVALVDAASATIREADGKHCRIHYRRDSMPDPVWVNPRRHR